MKPGRPRRYEPDVSNDRAIVEVKASLTAARGLRDALMSLAMELAEKDELRGYLLLLDPGLSRQLLNSELCRFKAALRPELAERLRLILAKGGKVDEKMDKIHEEDRDLIEKGIKLEESRPTLAPASKQDEVFLVMLHQWVTGRGPMSSKWLEETVGCHYRTVASAIEKLGPAVKRFSDRSVTLKYFPEQDWGRLLANTYRVRFTVLYSDTSGQPRSPESLIRRLQKLNRHDVAIGGVVGAKRYFAELDIVGTPRVDLCIHSPSGADDLEVARSLDPALKRGRDEHSPAQLALHFVRRKESLFEPENDGSLWADPVECLLDLYHARLDMQARSFQDYLAMQGRELNGND